jgi:hypothetical protein
MNKIFYLPFVLIIGLTTNAQKAPKTKTVSPLCNAVQFYYTASTNVVSGFATTFTWTRAAVTGIANPAGSGTSAIINEYLNNTTANPLLVKYAITMTENTGCSHTDSLFITINSTPHLSSALTASICDSTAFIYTAATATIGTVFTWSRAAVTGIANAAASGSGTNINEVLSNTTNNDVVVPYVITMVANGCTNSDIIYVTVHPTPFLVKLNKRRKQSQDILERLHLEATNKELIAIVS